MKFFFDRDRAVLLFAEKSLFYCFRSNGKNKRSSEYSQLSQSGFRRSGKIIYRPQCKSRDQCIPIRIPVENFIPKRRHRRILAEIVKSVFPKSILFFQWNISISIPNTSIIVTILTTWTLHLLRNIEIF